MIHELLVSHGFAPVHRIDLVLLQENMNNIKELFWGESLGEKNWLLRIQWLQLFPRVTTTRQSPLRPTGWILFFLLPGLMNNNKDKSVLKNNLLSFNVLILWSTPTGTV